MRIDGINLVEGSSINNATLASGADFPDNADIGELFYISDDVNSTDIGLYVYTASGWQRILFDGEGGGIDFTSTLSGLSPSDSGAFTNGNTLQEALQAILNTGIGYTHSASTLTPTLNSLATVSDLISIPSGKVFTINGSSSSATWLNSILASSSVPYSAGNANSRDTLIKLISTTVTVGANTYKKAVFSHTGQIAGGSVSLFPRRLLSVLWNITTDTATYSTMQFADQASLPTVTTSSINLATSGVAGTSSEISAFNYYSRTSSVLNGAVVSGSFTITSDLAAGSSYTFFNSVAQSVFLLPPVPGFVGANSRANFQVTDPNNILNLPDINVQFVHNYSGNTQGVIVINRGSTALPSGTYVFNGAYAS